MKVAGAIVIIIASYIIGYSRRSAMLLGEKIIGQFIHLIKEIKSSVEYGVGSLADLVASSADKESYDKLTFLSKACASDEMHSSLSGALCTAFDGWEHSQTLSKDERAVVKTLLSDIGKSSSDGEISKLDFAAERLKASLETRHEFNSHRRGYYETIYLLAGIAIAIIII